MKQTICCAQAGVSPTKNNKKKTPKQTFDSFAGASFDLRQRRWIDDASAINFAFKERKTRASVCVEWSRKNRRCTSTSGVRLPQICQNIMRRKQIPYFRFKSSIVFFMWPKISSQHSRRSIFYWLRWTWGAGRLGANTLFTVSIVSFRVWFVCFLLDSVDWITALLFTFEFISGKTSAATTTTPEKRGPAKLNAIQNKQQ